MSPHPKTSDGFGFHHSSSSRSKRISADDPVESDRDYKRSRCWEEAPVSDRHDRDRDRDRTRDRERERDSSGRHKLDERLGVVDDRHHDRHSERERSERSSRSDRDSHARSSRYLEEQNNLVPSSTLPPDPYGDRPLESSARRSSRRSELSGYDEHDRDRESRRSSRRDPYLDEHERERERDRDRDRDSRRSSSRRDPYYDDHDRDRDRDSRRSSSRRDPYYDHHVDYDRGRRRGRSADPGPGDLGRDKGFGFSFGGAHHLGRYQSPSPASGTIPLDKRPRNFTKWDIAPPGYENIPAMEAKATNNFLLPCHKAVMKLQPGHLVGQTGVQRTQGYPVTACPPGSAAFQARTARRLYFGNIPRDLSDADLISYVNQQMQAVGVESSAMSASFGGDRSFAFIEFREASHASALLQYDGAWQFGGLTMRIKRPKDFVPGPGEEPVAPSISGNTVNSNNPDKLFIGGIPRNLTETQVRELLEAFGAVKSFNLIMDLEKGESKGYAFCEYTDGVTADVAIEGLNGMEIGERKLVVQRASIGPRTAVAQPQQQNVPGAPEVINGPPDGILVPALHAANGVGLLSRIMVLLNLASPDDIRQPHQYEELVDAVREECQLHGRLEDVIIPQIPEPSNTSSENAPQPVVQAFVIFTDEFECQNALRNICGRSYRGRTVVAAYFPESRWQVNDYYGANAGISSSSPSETYYNNNHSPTYSNLTSEHIDVIPMSNHESLTTIEV